MNAETRNLFSYALYALLGALVATGLQLAVALSGTEDILVRPLLATFTASFFGALSTAIGSSFLPRSGSTGIARQVNALRDKGYSRKQMAVVAAEPPLQEAA
jgi:formate hydrogenlyase subunit 4